MGLQRPNNTVAKQIADVLIGQRPIRLSCKLPSPIIKAIESCRQSAGKIVLQLVGLAPVMQPHQSVSIVARIV